MKKLLITLPCFNEEQILVKNLRILCQYAQDNFQDFDWRILVVDNASTDRTWLLALVEQEKQPAKILTDQEFEKGRGVALRRAWAKFSDFDIYSYMDADLATDLKDFRLLVLKANQGFDLVTGSRYLKESDIIRNAKREVLSRIYNLLLKIVLRVNFKDAQCGFKAFSGKIVRELVSQTQDNGWFWDTELMILAGRQGYRILEIPVSWREIRDEVRRSKVSHWAEVRRQLKNIFLMRKRLKNKNI
ncbi:MAG: glycosyltransferase [Candidatus Portnoybacteria bacterium]|jgi:glycosyltransferase involved in cell wall biosynthesis|nr:glycosyltransferase [Candidatus Portnoybacteria bacterium]